MRQVADGKEREAKNSGREIEVMTNAMLDSPLHPGKQMKCFEDMS
jgi:hypothetical protein